jgi:hypothetical protein
MVSPIARFTGRVYQIKKAIELNHLPFLVPEEGLEPSPGITLTGF